MNQNMRLHHVGVVVKDITKAAANYVDHLGYEIRSEVFHDPVQTAFVRFLALPGETSFLELVTPDGPGSKVVHALKKGGGIHHICYSVANIEESLAAMQSGSYLTLQAPVPAVAFSGRRIAWLMGRDHLLVELVEQGENNFLP
jgi:methylmalonyl-CoA/ethylmalonyl-CoA epimerase